MHLNVLHLYFQTYRFISDIIIMVSQVTPELSCPIALFSYYNPIQSYGAQTFISMIKDCGIHGKTSHASNFYFYKKFRAFNP